MCLMFFLAKSRASSSCNPVSIFRTLNFCLSIYLMDMKSSARIGRPSDAIRGYPPRRESTSKPQHFKTENEGSTSKSKHAQIHEENQDECCRHIHAIEADGGLGVGKMSEFDHATVLKSCLKPPPPHDAYKKETRSVTWADQGTCGNGNICEYREIEYKRNSGRIPTNFKIKKKKNIRFGKAIVLHKQTSVKAILHKENKPCLDFPKVENKSEQGESADGGCYGRKASSGSNVIVVLKVLFFFFFFFFFGICLKSCLESSSSMEEMLFVTR